MSRTKKQLVDSVVYLLTNVLSNKVTAQEKSFLEGCTVQWLEEYLTVVNKQVADKTGTDRDTAELQKKLDQIRAEADQNYANNPEVIRRREAEAAESEKFYTNYYLDLICRVVIDGKRVIRNKASESIIIGFLNPGETLSAEWFRTILKENPSLASRLPWRSANTSQETDDRETFRTAARQFGFGMNTANFKLVQDVLGEGLTVADIYNAIQSGLQLTPPSESELEQWHEQSIQEHNQKLLTLGPNQLRVEAKRESADQRVQQEQKQANDSLEASKQRDAATAFPALPAEITREVIRSAASGKLRFWIQKYGNFNVTARLQGRG